MPQPRKPTAVLERTGAYLRNPKRKRERAEEPVPSGELGEPPAHFRKDEREAWNYIVSILPEGVAFISDRIAMEEAAWLLARCRDRKAVVTVAERQLLRSYLVAFGLTPADRSRVKAKPQEKPKDDKWAAFNLPSSKPQ